MHALNILDSYDQRMTLMMGGMPRAIIKLILSVAVGGVTICLWIPQYGIAPTFLNYYWFKHASKDVES